MIPATGRQKNFSGFCPIARQIHGASLTASLHQQEHRRVRCVLSERRAGDFPMSPTANPARGGGPEEAQVRTLWRP